MNIKSSHLEPRERRHIKGYGFLSFTKGLANNLVNKGITKKLTDVGKDFGKTAGKKILTKSAEATGDLVGSKIADKITKVGKNKKGKNNSENTSDIRETDKIKEVYLPPEKRQQIIDEMRLL